MQGNQLCRLLYRVEIFVMRSLCRVEISVMQKLALCRNICHAGICVLQKYTKSMNDRTGKEERTGKMAKEPKKLALLRIWQILQQYSDEKHLLTQDDIIKYLDKDYGIVLERKSVGRNLSLLREADIEIRTERGGSYLVNRDFEDSELRLLIDGVVCSRHIEAGQSKDLIERLCRQSNQYFKSHVKNIYSVNDWSKIDNQALFYNIEIIDNAIEEGKRVQYHYNKYGTDKELHVTSRQVVSPYRLILHNQRYYLMAYSEYWGNMVYHRLDKMTDMEMTNTKATPIKSVPGFENGIDYKKISSSMPYMFSSNPVTVDLIVDTNIIDQVIDWFGKDFKMAACKEDESKTKVIIKASPDAMKYWALQYIDFVEVVSPDSVRDEIRKAIAAGMEKYK